MDRRQTLEDLAWRLATAAGAADWAALEVANDAVARILPQLAQRGDWATDERAALVKLRAVHEQAYRDCSHAKDRLALTLGDMRDKKEGWMAYALIGDTDADGNLA